MNKKTILCGAILCAISNFASYAQSKQETSVSGSGNGKAQALANALQQAQYGAEIKRVHFNGYSIKTKEGEKSYYKCKVIVGQK
jgi:ABC-type metal ion transport system substrate-binding protein